MVSHIQANTLPNVFSNPSSTGDTPANTALRNLKILPVPVKALAIKFSDISLRDKLNIAFNIEGPGLEGITEAMPSIDGIIERSSDEDNNIAIESKSITLTDNQMSQLLARSSTSVTISLLNSIESARIDALDTNGTINRYSIISPANLNTMIQQAIDIHNDENLPAKFDNFFETDTVFSAVEELLDLNDSSMIEENTIITLINNLPLLDTALLEKLLDNGVFNDININPNSSDPQMKVNPLRVIEEYRDVIIDRSELMDDNEIEDHLGDLNRKLNQYAARLHAPNNRG